MSSFHMSLHVPVFDGVEEGINLISAINRRGVDRN